MNQRKTIDKHFRFSEEENIKLKDLSYKSRISETEVIRSLLDSAIIKEAPPRQFYDAINLINKIGVNINQLTHVANSTGDIYKNELNNNFNKLNDLIDDLRNKFL